MFFKCSNLQEIKSLYRQLSKHLHPDRGGSNELMALLTEAYEEKVQHLSRPKKRRERQVPKESVDDKIHKGDEKLSIFVSIYEFSAQNPKFNTNYVDSCLAFFEKADFITMKQYEILEKICERWNIPCKAT